jgi:putative hydrolase of the HAD superfamily
LIPAVEDVLAELATRHDLYLMTKGARDEQQRKIEASGLADRFRGVDIVPTKQPETYLRIVAERGLESGRTWMIGNSPKSDVLAARAAGLRAVFVPHPNTWEHEHAELDPSDDGILEVRSLAELLQHF